LTDTDDLDALYRAPPDGFIAGRDELAKKLKADGRKDDAATVKKLRKPSAAAALVNWLSLEHSEELKKFALTLGSMREGAGGGKGLRAAVKAEREQMAELMELVEGEAKERGSGSPATIDRVAETLRAIATDPDLEASVLAGRLEREGEASTIGFELAVTASTGGAPSKASKGGGGKGKKKPPSKEKGPDLKAERAALKSLEDRLAAAEEREEEAGERLERAEQRVALVKDALAGAKDDTKAARAEVKKQERRLKKLQD